MEQKTPESPIMLPIRKMNERTVNAVLSMTRTTDERHMLNSPQVRTLNIKILAAPTLLINWPNTRTKTMCVANLAEIMIPHMVLAPSVLDLTRGQK